MGCTSGKTSNPNKNLNNNPVQPRSPLNQHPTLLNNQSPIAPNIPQSNFNSNTPNQNLNMPNHPSMMQSMTTPTKNIGQQLPHQVSGVLGQQRGSNINAMTSSIRNSASPNNLHASLLHQSGLHLGSPHMNNSLHASGFKPGQYETQDTADDEMVNQEKSMNFDLGIKFNMQIEVE